MIGFLYKTRYNNDRGIDEKDLNNIADQQSTKLSAINSSSITERDSVSPLRGPLLTNAQIYILSNKYNILSLREVATAKFKEIVEGPMEQ